MNWRSTSPPASAWTPTPALAATLLLLQAACAPSEPLTLGKGDPAPAFSTVSLRGGHSVSLADYRGATLLVNLWATWCGPCKTETPYLQSLYEEHRDRGLRILGVSVDRHADLHAVADFVEEMGVEYDIGLDPTAASREAFRAPGLPMSVLIDREGLVAFSWIGPIPEGDPTFLAGLEDTLLPGYDSSGDHSSGDDS